MKCLLLINVSCWYYVTAEVFYCSQTPVIVWEARMCCCGEYTRSLPLSLGTFCSSWMWSFIRAFTAPRGWLESEDASGQACWLLTHSKCVLRWRAASCSSLTWLLFTVLEVCQPVGLLFCHLWGFMMGEWSEPWALTCFLSRSSVAASNWIA